MTEPLFRHYTFSLLRIYNTILCNMSNEDEVRDLFYAKNRNVYILRNLLRKLNVSYSDCFLSSFYLHLKETSLN